MGAILDDTKEENFPKIVHYGAEILARIRKGQDVEGIRRRIVSLVLSGEIDNGELFVFHDSTWDTQREFSRALQYFQRSVVMNELSFENDL